MTLTREMGQGVDIDEVSLDITRYAQEDMEGPFVQFLLARLTKWQPDLVVPIGSPAGGSWRSIGVASFHRRR
jgi:hypothetical protein